MFVYPESHFFSLEKSEIHTVIGRKVNFLINIICSDENNQTCYYITYF